MRILLAEENRLLADNLTRSLRLAGYAADCVQTGEEADTAITTQEFDLLILSVGLPKLSGLEVLRRLRLRNVHLPTLILAPQHCMTECVKSLDLGADDYMAKPLCIDAAFDEMRARIRALLRRSANQSAPLIKYGTLSYDQAGHVAYLNEKILPLSARELGLLEILLQRVGRLVSKHQLVDHLCEWGEEVSSNAIEVYVHRLRKKIAPGGIGITTVRGLGYCLEK